MHLAAVAQLCCDIELVIDPEKKGKLLMDRNKEPADFRAGKINIC